MTDLQILNKAWKKALKNGFKPIEGKHLIVTDTVTGQRFGYESWLFDHNFAKALWGEEETKHMNQVFETITKHGWQHHLKAMVIAKNPIKYLGENI